MDLKVSIMYHFDRSEIVPPERNGKQYIFPSFFKRLAQAKSFLYNANIIIIIIIIITEFAVAFPRGGSSSTVSRSN